MGGGFGFGFGVWLGLGRQELELVLFLVDLGEEVFEVEVVLGKDPVGGFGGGFLAVEWVGVLWDNVCYGLHA